MFNFIIIFQNCHPKINVLKERKLGSPCLFLLVNLVSFIHCIIPFTALLFGISLVLCYPLYVSFFHLYTLCKPMKYIC